MPRRRGRSGETGGFGVGQAVRRTASQSANPLAAPRSARVSRKTDRSQDRRGQKGDKEKTGKREKERGTAQTVRTTSVETVHREGWKGIRDRGRVGTVEEEKAEMRPQLRRYRGAAHLGSEGRVRRDALREVGRVRGGEKDTGKKMAAGGWRWTWKSLEKLGESPRCSRFSLTRG